MNIITLLQAVVVLLTLLQTNPNIDLQTKTQILAFANQAVQMATEQLQPATGTPTSPPIAPIVQTPIQQPLTTNTPKMVDVPQPTIKVFNVNPQNPSSKIEDVHIADPRLTGTYGTTPGVMIDGKPTLPNENVVQLGIHVYNADGTATGIPDLTITTPDSVQDTVRHGTGNIMGQTGDGGYDKTPYYYYAYMFKTTGNHTLTFSALGVSTSITMNAQ